ncbi:hypothetical protein [Dysgonomonas sp. Marseille-P4361]|uniref:hypothetical protein n=1 Tax=Dysgonomonas sp. Marseille-P4361 TaxID=2161820 RepID=UPI000D54FED4|nr:hypothetical protein [Dysgonomonas sp. Marseille-P4361]
MKIIEKIETNVFPFDWVNLECYPDSKGYRTEIYLKDEDNITTNLIFMFYELFNSEKENISIYNNSWYDFTLDIFNIDSEEADYALEDKSELTKKYLQMLIEANIEPTYSGSCKCLDWDKLLPIVIDCIVLHIAPYSPLFYNEKYDFFFYFHHTGSIGFYFKEPLPYILEILNKSKNSYRSELLV